MTNETVVFFENNFGKIFEGKLLIVNCNQELKINEVAFLDVKAKPNIKIKRMSILACTISLVGLSCFQNLLNVKIFFLIISSFFLLLAIFYNKKNMFIKIILCYSKPLTIKIEKHSKKDAIEFIQYFKKYRIENPDLTT